jgi:hypothetical protein
MPFKRHLEQPFIEALNKLHDDQDSWWHALVRDEQVFMGIRSNAINAYAGGASIARIEWSNRRLQLRVNRKFLVLPKPTSADDSYADLLASARTPVEAVTVNDALQYVEHLSAIKDAARRLTGDERAGAAQVAASCACVLDVEAAFDSVIEASSSDEPVGSVGRVDVVAINDHGTLILTEAKLYSNGELRSRTEPVVCTQLIEYYNWARDHAGPIREAYSSVVAYRKALNLRSTPVANVVDLDVIPRLLIFGFDSAHRKPLADIKRNILAGLRGRIPGFEEAHIHTVGSPSNVDRHHLW